jgi:predicted urease superfamily metal-dependent hydrolase
MGLKNMSFAQDGQPPTRLALTLIEAAAVLGIHPNSLDRLVQRGLLRPSRALRRPLFSLIELERFLENTK